MSSAVARAFLCADIPLQKLKHPEIKNLFKKLGHDAPSESAARNHVPSLAEKEKSRIIETVTTKNIFMVVDESEINGVKYLNILVGTLEKPESTFLFDCRPITGRLSHETICQAVDDSIQEMSIERSQLCLILSDAARYMMKAGEVLKCMYPNLLHVTCVAHLLHNCCMLIRSHYPRVDTLIATIKSAVVKNKDRRLKFSSIGLPPRPVLTRWGTWIKAAFWYSENLPQVNVLHFSYI